MPATQVLMCVCANGTRRLSRKARLFNTHLLMAIDGIRVKNQPVTRWMGAGRDVRDIGKIEIGS